MKYRRQHAPIQLDGGVCVFIRTLHNIARRCLLDLNEIIESRNTMSGERELFSAQAFSGFFHGFALSGEKFRNAFIANPPETGNSALFHLFIAGYDTLFNLLV